MLFFCEGNSWENANGFFSRRQNERGFECSSKRKSTEVKFSTLNNMKREIENSEDG
jgi:hypothetical protein